MKNEKKNQESEPEPKKTLDKATDKDGRFCLTLPAFFPIGPNKKHAGYLIFYPFYPKVELIICQDALSNLAQRKTVQSAHPPPAIILVLKSLNQTLSA